MAPRPPRSLAKAFDVRIAGRIQTIRRMGKAGFAHLLQSGERLQIYVRKDAVTERDYAALPAARHRRHRRRAKAICSARAPAN